MTAALGAADHHARRLLDRLDRGSEIRLRAHLADHRLPEPPDGFGKTFTKGDLNARVLQVRSAPNNRPLSGWAVTSGPSRGVMQPNFIRLLRDAVRA